MNLYVSNFGFNKEDDDLREIFEKFGQVTSAKVIRDRTTGCSRGIGFVKMSTDEEGINAIFHLNNKEIDGRTIQVSIAKQKEEKKTFFVSNIKEDY
jgi:RNA recognition motif-containing protein